MICSRCDKKFGHALSGLIPTVGEVVCPECQEKRRTAAKRAAKVLVTTTPTIEGHRIVAYLGIESVEAVITDGLLVDVKAKRQRAKEEAMDALKTLAAEKDANAVVGVDMDYTEFSGNRLGVIISGTLVRAVAIDKPAKREGVD